MKLKFNVHLRLPRPHFREIKKIWVAEVFVAGALLLALLAWDGLVYYEILKTTGNAESEPDKSKIVALKKVNLEAATKKIDSYEEFLNNPNFTF